MFLYQKKKQKGAVYVSKGVLRYQLPKVIKQFIYCFTVREILKFFPTEKWWSNMLMKSGYSEKSQKECVIVKKGVRDYQKEVPVCLCIRTLYIYQ